MQRLWSPLVELCRAPALASYVRRASAARQPSHLHNEASGKDTFELNEVIKESITGKTIEMEKKGMQVRQEAHLDKCGKRRESTPPLAAAPQLHTQKPQVRWQLLLTLRLKHLSLRAFLAHFLLVNMSTHR